MRTATNLKKGNFDLKQLFIKLVICLKFNYTVHILILKLF